MKVQITLVSHYFGLKTTFRLNKEDAEELKMYGNGIDVVNILHNDYERIMNGFKPMFLTNSQARRLHNYFPKNSGEYFDYIKY